MKKFFFIALMIGMAATAVAQPAKRRTVSSNEAAKSQTARQASDRAALLFPTSEAMPEDVVWRRDIYRQLDLLDDSNAALYYPIEPVGTQCNLFTYIFRLFLTGRVPAYEYKLDGNESFAAKDKVGDVKEVLERYYIYYEEKDGKYTVADTDVPSAYVKRYYIKESAYLDQRTGTTSTKVTAICPVLLEGDDFGGEAAPKPLFWMKYDDLAPWLSKLPVMSSNYNNVTNMTADDYFTRNLYKGKIYKTANMQGRLITDYCKTDSAVAKEQKRIEQQLTDFEASIWTHKEKVDTASADSVVAEPKAKSAKRTATAKPKKEVAVSKGSSSTSRRSGASSSKQKSSSSASAPKASVRRTRR